MKNKMILLCCIQILFSTVKGRAEQDYLKSTLSSLKKLVVIAQKHGFKKSSQRENDLIIGATDPNEVVKIVGDYYLKGNILIVNNGILQIDSANFRLDGNIQIMGHGQLIVNGGTFNIEQKFIYEHSAIVFEHGSLIFRGVNFSSSGQSWSNAFGSSAIYELNNCKINDGFITTLLTDSASARIEETNLAGEFICFEKSSLRMSRCDTFIIWHILPENCNIDFSFPSDSVIDEFIFSDDQSGIDGIQYSIKLDSCRNPKWALMSMSGSRASFQNTKFLAIGLIFNKSDSIVITDVVNGSHYSNDVIFEEDRTLQLIDSDVQIWNFYAQNETKLTLERCIFGELLAQDSSHVMINNSICDGTGGYLGAFGKSELFAVTSLIQSQVISRENGVLLGIESAFWGNKTVATDYSVMLIANTALKTEPQAFKGSTIFEAGISPAEGSTNSMVPIMGTARLIKGPENPIEFEGYNLSFSRMMKQPNWLPLGSLHLKQVKDDTLEEWDTYGLLAGSYALQLKIHHSFGEPIAIVGSGYLHSQTGIDFTTLHREEYFIRQNYPNPFNSSTKISFYLPEESWVKITLFNVRGNVVKSLIDKRLSKGTHVIELNAANLTSGLYFYRMESGEFSQTKKMTVIK